MEIGVVVEHAQHIAAVRADEGAGRETIEEALRSVGKMQAWLVSCRTQLTTRLAGFASFPEHAAADCTRGSTRDAVKDRDRGRTLDDNPGFADALDNGTVTEGHVDALTNTAKSLDDDDQRQQLFDRVANLVGVAEHATVEQWRRRLGTEAKSIRRGDGMDRLERQRRATGLRTWTDGEGMVCLSGRFDPVSGRALIGRLDNAVEALFTTSTPDTCPVDPIAKQHHLNALALVQLVDGTGPTTSGRPEYVVVIEASVADGAGGPAVDWGIPVEVPHRILADLMGEGSVHTVVVRNGVVLHAPGELDLGRSTRLANRAQRRALRAMYATCAIPGCSVRFDRCKIHHVVWWRNGGATDLANLLPICVHHHSKVHDAGWDITLGANRELTIRFPDGTVRNTGPPTRIAA